MGFLSLLRLRVLFALFLKLSEPVTHTLSFGRSVLFLGRFLSVLNCLLPFCKVLVILCHNSLCFAVSFHKCLYINLDGQYLTVRRSMRYNGQRHKTEIGATKRKKVRTVDFCDTLADILRKAKTEQHKNRFKYGDLYHLNYYKEVKEKDRTYYEVYSLPRTDEVPDGYKEISFVCLRPDGAYESPSTVGVMTRSAKKKLEGFEDFHFHMLRHTFTSNLLSNGAAPKDVQELLGHADVSTTMNIYAHSKREAKRTSARLLDKVVGEA